MSTFLSSLAEPYLRWRHTRGFGVHSPYAYRLVTTVLHPRGVVYYGYANVDRSARNIRRPRAEIRRNIADGCLVLRLCAFLDARSVYFDLSVPAPLEEGACAVYGNVVFPVNPREADLIVAYGRKTSAVAMDDATRYGIPVMACHDDVDHAALQACFEANGCGVWLEGRRWSIIIPREHMAPVHHLVL